MKQRHRVIGDVRGRGLLIGIELVEERDSKKPAADLAEAVLYSALDKGVCFKITMGNVLTLTPPLITTEAQMDTALDVIDQALAENSIF
jgi:4-aminobutyrate aminotransferase